MVTVVDVLTILADAGIPVALLSVQVVVLLFDPSLTSPFTPLLKLLFVVVVVEGMANDEDKGV